MLRFLLPAFVPASLALALAAPAPAQDAPAATAKEAKKWDVMNPPGPKVEVAIDTDEGTWMSVDVSPDGKQIVFDLLGDIYVIPSTGGEAKALTSGIAWDEQARFSPDGARIAFTSDRGGGDNIWVMPREGGEPKAVTQETFRLLNSPTWTPDGEYIAARKHFTSTRSAGAGEIWLYHRSGGEGVQMTEKPNEQKDLGEPAFSPDGRYLYYSQDATPGSRFEYNKDPNTQIYVIKRLDRRDGRTIVFVSGPGGAIRPTPSPDGKKLAFIRRVRGKTVLLLADVDSGHERALFDGLDRDLQETWAIHGVYPGLAWTPDSRALVFWCGGKFHRLEVASGSATVIPFHVRDSRTLVEAVHSSREVAPARFHTKMLRWVQVSPRGDNVVYQALGHLYIRALPDGKPRRLTSQNDHFEFYPSWSRDGKSIVYVSWDDDELGAVRVVSARGGDGRKVTPHPGHFVEPVFSPDGRRIVYRAVQGGSLRSPEWSHEPGIYWVPAAGGTPQLVTLDGFTPHFGAANDRVYLVEVKGDDDDKRELVSVELDGSDRREHLKGVYFTAMRVSPDDRWVAFEEGYRTYIAPFVPAGKTIEIGPKMKNLPATRVSRNAGESLHWSGDAKKLYWSLGPELFERDLVQAFTFVPGAPEKLPELPEHGRDLGFEVASDAPQGKVAFTGARLVTMRGDEGITDGVLLVEGNRIVAVGPSAAVQVPSDAFVVDVAGNTIVPGFVDVHWHGPMGQDQIIPEQSWVDYAALAFGVTTLHDPSNDTGEIFAASELARAGSIVAPRIFSTGTILYGAKYDFKAEIDSLPDARAHLERLRAAGAFSVKSYNQPRRDQRQQVLAAARELGMLVVPEGGSLFQHNMNMIVDGHTGIEHSIPLGKVYKDVVQLWSGSHVAYTPTLIVGYGGLFGENYWYGKTDVWANPRLASFVPRRLLDARARRPVVAPPEEYGHMANAAVAKRLLDAGVQVQLGAHGQREGLGAHWEMWMFVQGGMTPLEALRCGTLHGARYLGMDRDIGSLEVGKLADFVVLERNPLEDIRNTDSARYTVLNGRVYDAHTMDELGRRPRKRHSFYFERTETSASLETLLQDQHRCAGCRMEP
ncbi:MAG TPA: amidohydrolase family protein [Candidatus Krumholzibacteria bacterium]|nr:amidohydrolase family protein [Candidatus Krumholzibacteria bacterium]